MGRNTGKLASVLLAMALAGLPAWDAAAQPIDQPVEDINQLQNTLLERGNTSRAARVDAARRLAARQTPQARTVLAAALQESGNPAAQYAAAVALASEDAPDPAMIDPLFVLIAWDVQQVDLARAAATALTRYRGNDVVLQRLIDRTADRRGEASRRATIQALGALPEKRVAETLIRLLSSPDESREVRAAAVAALTEMTGAALNGNDVGRWRAWWEANRNLSDAQFREAIIASKASRYDVLRPAQEQLVAATRERLAQMYRRLPPEQRTGELLAMLGDESPPIRAIATAIVREDKLSAASVPQEVQERLRQMVDDVDPSVRFEVANALWALNYAPALDAILAQLPREPNPEVRAALARSVAPIQDLRAVPILVSLLADSDNSVARAAALALKDLGPLLRREGTVALVDTTAAALLGLLRRTTPQTDELREAAVDAMAPLARESLIPDLARLLARGESTRVRRNAIKALAEIGAAGRPEIADSIIPALEDSEAVVRLEAAQALQRLSRPETIASLLGRLDPRKEPDASVREAAWRAIEAQLPDTPPQQLVNILPQFSANDEQTRSRRIVVLKTVEDKYSAAKDEAKLAEVREELGRTYLLGGEPDNAIEPFRSALDYYKTQRSQNAILTLNLRVLEAYLKAGKFEEAAQFAAAATRENAGNAEDMGRSIRNHAEELAKAGRDAAALDLIARSEQMDPPLPDTFRKRLRDVEIEIRRRTQDSPNPTTTQRGPGSRTPRLLPSVPVAAVSVAW